MPPDSEWQCANCSTLVERTKTDRCPTCGHVFFYPVADAVIDSDGTGEISVEDFDLQELLDEEERSSS